ncbi:hypothetical protein ACWEKJ_19065 [Amycolatopsis thermoflava]|uniref:hypothetical protein n=1 Tax=Amycolatopsis thermoflava TaxID=84480 RepID=UPI003EB6EDF1
MLRHGGHAEVAEEPLERRRPGQSPANGGTGCVASARPESALDSAPGSLDHYDQGAVISFLHTHVAGQVRPDSLACKEIGVVGRGSHEWRVELPR